MASLPVTVQAEVLRGTPNSISGSSVARNHSSEGVSKVVHQTQPKVDSSENFESIELPVLAPNHTKASPSHVAELRSPQHRRLERIQFLTLCWCLFMVGWNDGSTGPLLPTMQTFYHIGFTVVSLVFITNCIGFVTGAAANVFLTDRIGFGKTIVLGAMIQVVAYSIQAPAPPFPVLCLGYALNGFGIALQDAQSNGYVAALQENAATKMGLLHAAYGCGALSSPLVATQFAHLPHWSFHYLCSLGIAITNTISLIWVFKGRRQDELLQAIGQTPHEGADGSQKGGYKEIWRTKNVHLLAVFILIYVGVEVTTGGWIVTYIMRKRGGGSSSGYVSSGFFGGLTFGRVALLWLNQKIGEYRVIYLYAALAIALELTIWFVPSLIENAVAVSVIGALLGPMYPIVMNHSARILPRWLLTGAIGWIAGFGQAGSAFLPFITGALAGKFGIGTLQPFLIANMCVMVVFWIVVPSKHERRD